MPSSPGQHAGQHIGPNSTVADSVRVLTTGLLKESLISACEFYGLAKSGTKEALTTRLIDFLTTAHPSDFERLPQAFKKSVIPLPPTQVSLQPPIPATDAPYMPASAELEHFDPFRPQTRVFPGSRFQPVSVDRVGGYVQEIPGSLVLELRRNGVSVHLRGLSRSQQLPGSSQSAWKFQYQEHMAVYVNNERVLEIQPPKPLKKRRDEPLDLTPYLRSGSQTNVVRVEVRAVFPNTVHVVGLVLVEQRSETELAAAVPDTEPSVCLARVLEILSQKTELEEVSRIATSTSSTSTSSTSSSRTHERLVELTCPISHSVIGRPVRGKHCMHLRIFDLHAYLFANKHTANLNMRWKCPVCLQRLLPQDLVVDGFFAELLRAKHAAAAVIFNAADATWRFPDLEHAPSHGAGAAAETGPTHRPELGDEIELSSASEGQPPQAKRPRLASPEADVIDLCD